MLCGQHLSRVLLRKSLNRLMEYTLPVYQQNRKFASNEKEYLQSLIGNREQVGFGMNGQPVYVDRVDYPFPAIRYKEPTPEVLALRGKECGNWRQLSIEEKKQIYRTNFCQTFAEMQAPTGEWKRTLGGTLLLVCASLWLYMMQMIFVYDELPDTFSPRKKEAQLRRMIDLEINPIQGISSKWDYEKQDWKSKGFFTPKNPFKDADGNWLKDVSSYD